MKLIVKAWVIASLIVQFLPHLSIAQNSVAQDTVAQGSVAQDTVAKNTNEKLSISTPLCSESQESALKKLAQDLSVITTPLEKSPVPQAPGPCGAINLRLAKDHQKCTTAQGAVFERVSKDQFGEAWKAPNGLVWSDLIGSKNQVEAEKACKDLGGSLPSRADFEQADAIGFREVLPHMNGQWIWSSTLISDHTAYANVFSGSSLSGGLTLSVTKLSDPTPSFRCIAK